MQVNILSPGLFALSRSVGKIEWQYNFCGKTFAELVQSLVEEYGNEVEDELLNSFGDFDYESITVLLNEKPYQYETLKDGDNICFLRPMAGG